MVDRLGQLQQALDGYQPPQPGLLERVFSFTKLNKTKENSAAPVMKGLYVYGSVGEAACVCVCVCVVSMALCVLGAGKTMLMDLFFESAGVSKKERVHFNSFMLDVHNSEQLLYSTGYNNYRYTDASQLSIHRPTFIHIYVLSASLCVHHSAWAPPPPPPLLLLQRSTG